MTTTPKRILILGAHGFIGNHLVCKALQQGYQVTAVSLHNTEFALPLPENAACTSLLVDMTQRELVQSFLKDRSFHYVINGSGYIQHTLYQNGGRALIDQHFSTLLNLVECLDRDILEGFVQIGSSDEYGNLPAPQSEASREAPISPYSLGKVASTQFLQMLHRTEAFPATIVRLFLAYGPGQNNQRFLPQIIQGCLADKVFPTSAGEQLRDFCYVEDLVDGILSALTTPQAHGEVINLASGTGVSIRSMIETVCHVIGRGRPQFGEIPYRPGENMRLYADIAKAKAELGWQPHTSIEHGLRKTIEYYQQQSNEYYQQRSNNEPHRA